MKSIFGGFLDGRDARIDGEYIDKKNSSTSSPMSCVCCEIKANRILSIILKKSLDDVSAGTTNFTYKQ